ncbi:MULTISPECIES: isochorismatase family protein [Neisseria]|uniref:Isochorismatase family protein n=1 Tax=Neisseria musculi TaxID=1815583 RepID=A0A7H1MEM4_9NEIS|nr:MULTISPECIES: isochorismatase family protein [Neisseria]MBF0804523.1 isochorismatase family protein [Neisseria sp. 19428wB4_WF04]QNT60089.1 isochorismatase family protein [Neisseria musculi]TFU40464.1 isochorismatase family protein [Neisseria sp. WF04]
MNTIAIDIQPQCRFSCFAANDQQCVHQPENIVPELNRQARFAQKRVLVENTSTAKETLCASLCRGRERAAHNLFTFSLENHFPDAADCRGIHLLKGLPCPADYDHAIEAEGDKAAGVCFHDNKESRSTGLIEWLYAQNAQTIILGGLATEHAVLETAQHLAWYNDNWHVIVNLSACRGYTPEGTLKAVSALRQAGITVVTDTDDIPAAIAAGAPLWMSKVS